MTFSALRTLLNQPPSREVFASCCRQLEQWKEGDFNVAFDYVKQHIEHWDPSFKHTNHFSHKKNWWPLVTSLKYRTLEPRLPKSLIKKPLHFQHLQHLDLSPCEHLEHLDNLRFLELKGLTKLCITGCKRLRQINGLLKLENLEVLDIENCWHLQGIQVMKKLPRLRELYMSGCFDVRDYQPLKMLNDLEVLSIEPFDNYAVGEMAAIIRQLKKEGNITFLHK